MNPENSFLFPLRCLMLQTLIVVSEQLVQSSIIFLCVINCLCVKKLSHVNNWKKLIEIGF